MTASSFEGSGIHEASEWEAYHDEVMTSPITGDYYFSKKDLVTAVITVMEPSSYELQTIWIRVRYKSSVTGWSAWSSLYKWN